MLAKSLLTKLLLAKPFVAKPCVVKPFAFRQLNRLKLVKLVPYYYKLQIKLVLYYYKANTLLLTKKTFFKERVALTNILYYYLFC